MSVSRMEELLCPERELASLVSDYNLITRDIHLLSVSFHYICFWEAKFEVAGVQYMLF